MNAYAGCCYCSLKGEYSRTSDKVVYLQHCAFLPTVNKLHSDYKNFPNKKVLKLLTPKTMDYVDTANGSLSAVLSQSENKKILHETEYKGMYATHLKE